MKIKNTCPICKMMNAMDECMRHPSPSSRIAFKLAAKPVSEKINAQIASIGSRRTVTEIEQSRFTADSCLRHKTILPADAVAFNDALSLYTKLKFDEVQIRYFDATNRLAKKRA